MYTHMYVCMHIFTCHAPSLGVLIIDSFHSWSIIIPDRKCEQFLGVLLTGHLHRNGSGPLEEVTMWL